ncbi:MAG: DUF192 domain-containing protein [Candidatus Nanoarchaeia archaeon]|nr:DUF192 domain-containing protein [Candidatus Nanoarchaeia archaeon]
MNNNQKILINPISKFLGFRFRKKSNLILLFDLKKETKIGAVVDTLFVFYPIRVIWLDKNKKIIKTKIMKPFTFVIPKSKARYIIESFYE